MRVYVGMEVKGRFSCEIDISKINEEVIKQAAFQKFKEADFGELLITNREVIFGIDENDNIVYRA